MPVPLPKMRPATAKNTAPTKMTRSAMLGSASLFTRVKNSASPQAAAATASPASVPPPSHRR